jgi:hypothetical protein
MENSNLSNFRRALLREGADHALARITRAGADEGPILRMLDALVDRDPRSAALPECFDLRKLDRTIRSLMEVKELLARLQGTLVDTAEFSGFDHPTTAHVVSTIDEYIHHLERARAWIKIYNTRQGRHSRMLKHAAIAFAVYFQTKRHFYAEISELIEAAYRVRGINRHLSGDALKRFYRYKKDWLGIVPYCDLEIAALVALHKKGIITPPKNTSASP